MYAHGANLVTDQYVGGAGAGTATMDEAGTRTTIVFNTVGPRNKGTYTTPSLSTNKIIAPDDIATNNIMVTDSIDTYGLVTCLCKHICSSMSVLRCVTSSVQYTG
jgi:hypothetical protein